MTDQTGTDKLSQEYSQIGRDRRHPIPQVLVQLWPIILQFNDLNTKSNQTINH